MLMIEVSALEKKYDSREALAGISFAIEKGEIFGLLGPNGAGKTTTVRILTGQLDFDAGSVVIRDCEMPADRKVIRDEMGVVPEEANLYERLTVEQNLQFFCRLYDTDFSAVEKYLKIVGLLQERERVVGDLSKGMKQRVLLIRALLHEPDILFLDEPTAGLDPVSGGDIHQLLQDLNDQGKTILLTSHNMEEVDKLCDRVAFLNQGQIVALDRPDNLKLKYSSRKLRVLFKKDERRRELVLDMDSSEDGKKLAQLMAEGKLAAVHSCEPSLADIFVKVTGRELV